jgi:hypothetical protein
MYLDFKELLSVFDFHNVKYRVVAKAPAPLYGWKPGAEHKQRTTETEPRGAGQ